MAQIGYCVIHSRHRHIDIVGTALFPIIVVVYMHMLRASRQFHHQRPKFCWYWWKKACQNVSFPFPPLIHTHTNILSIEMHSCLSTPENVLHNFRMCKWHFACSFSLSLYAIWSLYLWLHYLILWQHSSTQTNQQQYRTMIIMTKKFQVLGVWTNERRDQMRYGKEIERERI